MNIRKILLAVMLIIMSGCAVEPVNSNQPVMIESPKKTPQEIKEEGNPFVYYEYNDKKIPVLTAPLPVGEKYYLVNLDLSHQEFVPTSYVLDCMVQSNLFKKNVGDSDIIEGLALYVDVTADEEKREGKMTGYLKNSGNLYVEGRSSSPDILTKEQLLYFYSKIIDNDAYLKVDYSYLDNGNEEVCWGNCLYDAQSKELIEKEVYKTTTKRFSLDEIPEYKHDVVKDPKEIKDDLSNRMYCLDSVEESSDMLGDLASEVIRLEISRVLESGYFQRPLALYVYPELAYIRDFELHVREDNDGIIYERELDKDKEKYFFDENWNLIKYQSEELEVEYTRKEKGVELQIHNLADNSEESVEYEFQ